MKRFGSILLAAAIAALLSPTGPAAADSGARPPAADSGARPPAADSGARPAAVQAIVDSYTQQCTQLGGTLPAGQTPAMMSADLDGDDQPDFVINPQRLQCSAAATAFCGNGGCQIAIALSADGYAQPIRALGGLPTMIQADDGTRVEISVGRENCGDVSRATACWAVYSWPGGTLTTSYVARPGPQ